MNLLSKLLFLVLCFTMVVAQQTGTLKKLELRGPWRLNTTASDLGMKLGELRIAHNLDFGANLEAMTIRRGYDSVSTISGMDSILGIYGAYYSDGTQQLFIVADSNGTGYGNVYVTNKGSVNLTADSLTRIWQYWGIQNRSSFAMHNDNVYIVNGQQKGIVWNGTVARTWPPRAPGEPLIIPLNDAGNLDGEYIYRFAVNGRGVGGTAYLTGYADGMISSRIRVKSGKVLLTKFPEPTYDSTGNLRRWIFTVNVNTVSNTTDYWITVGDDSAGITSDGSATGSEITDSLIVEFTSNVDSAIAVDYGNDDNFIVKGEFDYGPHGGISNSANLTLTLDTTHQYKIYRTNANPGRIETTDSVDLVKAFTVHYTDSAFYTDTSFTDNVADGSLDASLYSDDFYGRDSLGVLTMRYGAPGYISMDTSKAYVTGRDDSTQYGGIFYGFSSSRDSIGVVYTCTFIDTITGWESDTGRSLFVWSDIHDPPFSITVSLPRQFSDVSGLITNLYRANMILVGYEMALDTLTTAETNYLSGLQQQIEAMTIAWGDAPIRQGGDVDDPSIMTQGDYQRAINRLRRRVVAFVKDHNITWYTKGWTKHTPVDSLVISEYYLVGQYANTVTEVLDSLRYDLLLNNAETYSRGGISKPYDRIIAFENRLWGMNGSRLWKSSLLDSPMDTVSFFGQVPAASFNRFDGDQITLVYPSRGVLRVYKNYSNYNLFQNSALVWKRVEVSGTFGCIAPNSYAKGFGGHYYLSDAGVIRETEGPNLERTQSIELISAPIKSFDQMSLIDKSKAIGFYDDRKYMLYIPAAGTTYVYDERANSWSTWDLVFQGATKYGVESELGFFPGDTMYYFNGNTLYRYGLWSAWNTDASPTPVVATWQTGPLFVDGSRHSIERIGAWIKQDAGNYFAKIAVTDESGTVSDSVLFNRIATDSARYVVKGIGVNSGVFLLLGGTNQVAVTGVVPSIIDGIDIWYTEQGEVLVE